MTKHLCIAACCLALGACAPVLHSTITPPPDMPPVQKADRVLIKGFAYSQHYAVGRDNSFTPAVGVGYTFGKIGSIIAHTISTALGFSYTQTGRELYGDIGTVRNALKTQIEDSEVAKGVATLQERQELGLAAAPRTLIYDGKSGNEAIAGVTPWYWCVWNAIDYITLMAFLGVPTHYERAATVTLGVYNEKFERIGKYEGYALMSKACYIKPGEDFLGLVLINAYKDAVNKAAAVPPRTAATPR